MNLIGVAGQARQGKDCLADALQLALGGPAKWQRTAFAGAVKQIFQDVFGKDAEYTEKWKVVNDTPPDLDMTVRKALQFIGDGFRQIKGSIWIDLMFRDEITPRIISDVRYPNELAAIKKRGGFTVLVVRPEMINDDPNGSEAEMKPFSEYAMHIYRHVNVDHFYGVSFPDIRRLSTPPIGWNNVDYVVINNRKLEDFYDVIGDHVVPAAQIFFKDSQ